MDEGPSVVIAVFGAIAVIGAIIFGGWEAGWWFHTQDVNREAHVNRSSYGFQQSHMDTLSKDIAEINSVTTQITQESDPNQKSLLAAQRFAQANDACRVGSEITEPTPDMATWLSQNCMAGTVSPQSSFAPH
jgi:hypothetical protein